MYKHFLLKVYIRTIKHLFTINDFETLSNQLRTRKVILTMQRILNIIYNKKVSIKFTKLFLTTFISSKFTDVLTNHQDIKDDTISYSIHLISIKIVNTLKNILTEIPLTFMISINSRILKKEGIKLISGYRVWEVVDKKKIITELIHIYIENYEFMIKHPELKETIENEQKETLKKAILINKHIDENYFKMFLQNYIENKTKLKNMISTNMNQAYWDHLKEEIDNKNFGIIVPMLTEVKALLKDCVKNRKDIHVYIDDQIDCEFIQQMIDNDGIDDDYISNMSKFIYGYLCDFQSRNDDKLMSKWYHEIIKYLKNREYSLFFSKFFKTIIDRLNKIIEFKKLIKLN